ncbi:MAG: ATP-binding protein [Syntrophales bacterium]
MRSRLFIRIFGTYLLTIILAAAIVYLFVGHQIRSSSMKAIRQELLVFARLINLSPAEEIRAGVERLAGISGARVTLIDSAGNVAADSEGRTPSAENHLTRPEIQEAMLKGEGVAIRYSRTLGVDMMYVAVRIAGDSETKGYLRLARPLHSIQGSMDDLYRGLFTSILVMIVPSFLMALIFSYRLVSPIREMERFTEKLRMGQTPGALLIREGDEMKQLADNINYLVMELQNQIQSANEEKGKLLASFASMTEGVLLLNKEERIEVCNRAFRKMIASQYGDVAGKTLIEAFRNIELQRAFNTFKATRTYVSVEIALGEINPMLLDVSISPVHGLPAGEEKTLLVFHDVTRLKKLEKMRVDFVANVTHEIKTPLTAIMGFIETLEEGALEDKETARKFLDIISQHAHRLDRLLEDLLTISNIELGEMKFFFESVSLGGIVESVMPIVESRAREKGIAVEKEIPEALPPIRADRDRLVQILLNVLDNAVKFTREGKVSITAFDGGDGHVSVRISDTGVGVPRDEISRLGERFYRVDKTRSRDLGGTGLGLSIVKHLMIAHNGRMEIQSQLGKGTTVTLLFPVYSP